MILLVSNLRVPVEDIVSALYSVLSSAKSPQHFVSCILEGYQTWANLLDLMDLFDKISWDLLTKLTKLMKLRYLREMMELVEYLQYLEYSGEMD